jgi:phosphatidylserine decarboxylase
VAVQAVPFLLLSLALGALLAWWLGPWGAAPAAALAGFVLFFFRDPSRHPPEGEDLVLSPADGRVMDVERRPDGARVSIFLSVFDCHINRSPVAGTVRDVAYTRGRYRPAWDGRAARDNERNHLAIDAADGRYGVTQIAGILARRIVCTKRAGDPVARGERIGLIRFGSRTDLHLPPGLEPLVEVGDRVRGGLSVLADRAAAAGRRAAGAAP